MTARSNWRAQNNRIDSKKSQDRPLLEIPFELYNFLTTTLTLQHLLFWKKNKGCSLRVTLKILRKGKEKRTKKQGKSENEKSKEIEKARVWGQGISPELCATWRSRGKKRCHFWAFSAYFLVFGAKKGREKTRAQPWYARKSGKSLGPAKNHPWMLTTLGCPGTPDPRNSSVEKFLSWGIPGSRASLAGPTGMVNLSSGIYRLRNSSGQEFPGIQGWWASKGGSWPAQKSWPRLEGREDGHAKKRQKSGRGTVFVQTSGSCGWTFRVASSEPWGPISCTLLRAAWQAHAECTPKIGPTNLSEEENPAKKGLPLPLGRGVCETKSKNGRARPRKPFVSRVFCAQRGVETMVWDHGLGRGQTMG